MRSLNRLAKHISTMAKSITRQSRSDLAPGELISLTERCPGLNAIPRTARCFRLRKMKPSARLQWFQALTEEDLDFLAPTIMFGMNVKLTENRVIQALSSDLH